MPWVAPLDRVARLAAHDEPVIAARHVDSTRKEALARLGVATIGDLLEQVPFRYIDLTEVTSVADARLGTDATIIGVVHEVKVKKPRPRLTITEVALTDQTGCVIGVWFNQPWVAHRYSPGDQLAFAGRVELDFGMRTMRSPFVEKLAPDTPVEGRILPVHHSTEGLSPAWMRRLVGAAVDDFADIPDHLPARLVTKRGLVSRATALRDVHFPRTIQAAHAARARLAYDELLMLQLYMAMRRHQLTRERAGVAHTVDGPRLAALRASLPFELTDDQVSAIGEVLDDMARPRPMNRLLLGDVGTGKTVVATAALAAVADTGSQAAMMAPTEVLAEQYASQAGPILDAIGIGWALLTGSTPASKRAEVLQALQEGSLCVLFGTHALLDERVRFKRLTLAIVDEQHRFGVNQRLGLRGKGVSADLLVMTATPIPRSLALTLYGDLATSYLRSRPFSTSGVVTKHVKPHMATPAYEAVRAAVKQGRQAYVVCALVEESDAAAAKAAVREAERLRSEVFGDLKVGLLTGRMPPKEKSRVMDEFRAGRIDVLVSTTVIEVGVDVPNATVMLVEDAHRFGLAQLHQLRGRVGRGEHPGEVWLISDPRSADAKERITALLETDDGFELAERDLRLRGAGQLLGERQHGLPDLRVADLVRDQDVIRAAREDAFELVDSDPRLTRPEHGPLLERLRRTFAGAWEWVSSG